MVREIRREVPVGDVLPAAVGAVVSDLFSACGVPGASTVGMMLSSRAEAVMSRRRDAAREILLEELRKGQTFVDQAASIDEWVAVWLRYSRAAQEGAARLNLRLMAKVIAGQAQTGLLVADEFLAWAEVLASLRREEVVFIAALHAAKLAARRDPAANPADLEGLWGRVSARLVPSFFDNEERMRAVGYAAMRTGLIVVPPDFFALGYFTTSLQMERFTFSDFFQDALREEGIDLEGGHGCP